MVDFQPIFLIAAARSGTKLLRDVIAEHSEVDKVPFDINYIWRIGNEDVADDELQQSHLTPQIRERIKEHIGQYHKDGHMLIEKTVSNCIRIPFVDSIYPRAKYIHLIRQGEDVVESAYRQWNAGPDWRYILRKAKAFPLLAAPKYAIRYAINTFGRFIGSKSMKPAIWGPAYAGIHEDLEKLDLWQVCAIQWSKSIMKAINSFSKLSSERVFSIRYEEFVQQPEHWLAGIAEFLSVDPKPYYDSDMLGLVQTANVAKSKLNLTHEQRELIRPHIRDAMQALDYSFYE